jgi:hypothetical protein
MLLWRHRVGKKCSTEANYGRCFPGCLVGLARGTVGVKRGGNNASRRRAARLPEGPEPPSFDTTEAALQGDGPMLSAPWCERAVLSSAGMLPSGPPSTASLTACRASLTRLCRRDLATRAASHLAARWPMGDSWIAYRAFPGAAKHVLHELESDVLGWHFWRTRAAPSCQYRAEHNRPDGG